MHTLIRLTLVLVCATWLIGLVRESKCEDVGGAQVQSSVESEQPKPSSDAETDKKEPKSHFTGNLRRNITPPSTSLNSTRDSQLLSLLAARRRQLLNERVASHLNTLSTLSQKPYRNHTTFAQLEFRDTNNSVIKRITLAGNSTSNPYKIETTPILKETTQLEQKHFDPKSNLRNPLILKNRAGFLNNRRKEQTDDLKHTTVLSPVAHSEEPVHGLFISVPDDKLEGADQEVIVDPEEEFQVDESNTGGWVFVLNNTDSNDTSAESIVNSTQATTTKETTESSNIEKTTPLVDSKTHNSTFNGSNSIIKNESLILKDYVDRNNNLTRKENEISTENIRDSENKTLFISDALYNHFRPMETELPAEDMEPFLFFGQKISGSPYSGDNLTNLASTKSINLFVSPLEKKKYTSRYSATEKFKPVVVEEEEVNEDMDVSVVKNIIERNKGRSSVKVPSRQSLVNAYRKQTTTAPMIKIINETNSNSSKPISLHNSTELTFNLTINQFNKYNGPSNLNVNMSNIANTTTVRNNTKNYHNIRRRPVKIVHFENASLAPKVEITSEKPSTLVYTAVVTSVSITSSMKGQNKTDLSKDNDTVQVVENEAANPKGFIRLNLTESEPEVLPIKTSSTSRPLRRQRIRTNTPRTKLNETVSSLAPFVLINQTSLKADKQNVNGSAVSSEITKSDDLNHEEFVKSSHNRPELPRMNSNRTDTPNLSAARTNLYKRRRPTTTSTTSTIFIPLTTKSYLVLPPVSEQTTSSSLLEPEQEIEGTTTSLIAYTTTITPFSNNEEKIKISSSKEDSPLETSISLEKPVLTNEHESKSSDNGIPTQRNEEVVIEVEKSYTASYILAGLGFLPVTAIVIFVLRNFMAKKDKEIDTEYEGYFDDTEIKKESPVTPVARPPASPPSKPDQKWEFPRNKLRLQTLLGQGNFGQVWKAEADDLTGHDGLTRLVAVKTIKETATQKEKQELLHEICIMQKIGTHPNVVTLLACCTEQEPYLLIMEYVMCGKLLTYLRERRSRPDRFGGSGALTSRDLTVFAYCVARGMDYLASKGIVHRDLAARNVLVDHNKLCKIADFGMSRELSSEERGARAQRHALPVRWMAPEALLYNAYNHETDVWAFGILLWEIVTLGSTPYAAMSGREVLAAVSEGYRLERPTHCKPQLYRAMYACWHADPMQRPPFRELRSQLADLLDNEPSEGHYVDLDSFYQESSVYSDPSAIIPDDRLSDDYEREARTFRENVPSKKYDGRGFGFRDENLRNNFGIGSPRMGGFGIREMPFNVDQNFNERKEIKLSTSSFHRERERENPVVSRNSFSGGFQRLNRDFQYNSEGREGRNNRVPEFECDI